MNAAAERFRVSVQAYPEHPPEEIVLPRTLQEYQELWRAIETTKGDFETWKALMRLWSAGDHYFRLLFVMQAGRTVWNPWREELHFFHPSQLDLARRIQFEGTDNAVIIGARGWGKSTHLMCQDIGDKLVTPDHTTCYFSLTRELAAKHLGSLQQELDTNILLQEVWDDRFFREGEDRPRAARNSLKDGITIKRTASRIEQSWEARAFSDSLPTGTHFDRRRYDDIEADDAATSDASIELIEGRWISSQNLSSPIRGRSVAGTYYSPAGMMVKLQTKYGLTAWLYPGEDLKDRPARGEEGPMGGRPANGFTRDELWQRMADAGGAELRDGVWRRKSNPRAERDYGMQTACDPLAGEKSRLSRGWIGRYYQDEADRKLGEMNVVVCVDASNGIHDPTWIWVWGLTRDREFWWLDSEVRVLPPSERKVLVHQVCSRWRDLSNLCQLRIEQFGQAEYIQTQEEHHERLRFFVPILKCNDNRLGKTDRIYERWQAPAQEGRIRFPERMVRLDERGEQVDLVEYFLQYEWGMFPKPATDNGLDAGGLIWEPADRVGEIPWPARGRRETRRVAEEIGWASGGVV